MNRWVTISQKRGLLGRREVRELLVHESGLCEIIGQYGEVRRYEFPTEENAYRFARDTVFQDVIINRYSLLEAPKPILDEFK